MAAPSPKKSVKIRLNLLYPQGLNPKLPAKILKWLFSYGQFLLIAVEFLVVSVIIMRATLDEQLADLKDEIENQVAIVESLKPDEILIKQTQFKLDLVKKNLDNSTQWSTILTSLSSKTPIGVRFTTLNVDTPTPPNLTFRLVGKASNNNDLAIFINSLKKTPDFKNITLISIALEEGIINFTLTGNFSKGNI